MNKKVGIALGGGGARGCAHIGVIKALEEASIPISYVAGTSIGALMGGIYTGGDLEKLETFLIELKWNEIVKYMDITFPNKGLITGNKIRKLVKKFLTNDDFKKIKTPFTAVATDINSGEEVQITTGKVSDAIRASVCIPGMMNPADWEGRKLVDGGLTNPLPINVIKNWGADVTIAVDINHSYMIKKPYKENNNWFKRPPIVEVLQRTALITQTQMSKLNIELHQPDFVIQPDLPAIHVLEFHKAKELIEIGYQATQKIIPEIKEKLKS